MLAAFAGGAVAIGALGWLVVSQRAPAPRRPLERERGELAGPAGRAAPRAGHHRRAQAERRVDRRVDQRAQRRPPGRASAGEPRTTSAQQDDGKGDAELRVKCIPRCAAIRVGTHIISDGAPLRLPPGKHTILAVKQRYHSQQKHIELSPGATETLELRLIRK
jgi:hypothetical protein